MLSQEALSLPPLAGSHNWRAQCPFSDAKADCNLRGTAAIAHISNLLPAFFHAKEKNQEQEHSNMIPN